MTDEEQKVGHLWQGHRWQCAKLAVKSGAQGVEIITLAKSIDEYIMTKSELEKSVKPAKNDE